MLFWNHVLVGFSFIMSEQSTGVKVMAATVDTESMMLTIQPSELKSTPAIPLTIVRGRNTAMVVSVPPMTEIPTSLVANMAACFTREPRSICVVMFSSTTMALSTTIPIAIESELSEMMFNVSPVASR